MDYALRIAVGPRFPDEFDSFFAASRSAELPITRYAEPTGSLRPGAGGP
jgi:hypothetical protein